jgi:hypothetical protein
MPHIDAYTFGMATIDGHTYTSDLKIFPDKVKPGWWREEGHELHIADIEDALALAPEIIIIGTGASGALIVPQKIKEHIESLGIELTALPTKEAILKHNAVSKTRQTITCLHLTC